MVYQKRVLIAMALGCVATAIHADEYSNRLIRITQNIANEYDAQPGSLDPENMTSAGLQALNFITVENSISKNSPLGRKNKYITTHAQSLQDNVVTLLKLIQGAENIKGDKAKRDTILRGLWKVEMNLKQLAGEIADIKKKQLLPLSAVQKDLINLLTLLATKNLAITQRMIRNVEGL